MMMNGKFGKLGVTTDKPSRMPIILPDGEPLIDENQNQAYIDFLSWDSEPGRKFDQERDREQVRKGFRQRTRAELRNEMVESTDTIKQQADRLAVVATGWYLVDLDGKPIDTPFSNANALELFSSPELGWLRRQAWVFVSDETNFMRRSSRSSSPSPSTNSGSTDDPAAAPNAST